jgi:hypothetical protein
MFQEFDQTLSTVTKKDIKTRGLIGAYRAVSLLAVVGLVFSLFTPLMLLSNWFILCPLIGILCGLVGLYQIIASPFDYTGRYFAIAAVCVSLVCGISAGGWGIWRYYFSIPEGYTVIHFLELRIDEKTKQFPPHIVKLAKNKEKIYIDGFMFPGRQMAGIKDFTLVRTVEHCKFCSPEQNPFDMIYIHMQGDLEVKHRRTKVNVGGVLYLNEHFRYGEIPFAIEADYFR